MVTASDVIESCTLTTLLRGCVLAAVLASVAACQTPSAEASPSSDIAARALAQTTFNGAAVSLESALLDRPSGDDRRPLSDQQATDIEWHRSILVDPNIEAGIRTGAALRLLHMELPQATAVLVDALQSKDEKIMAGVIDAMQQASVVPADELRDAAIHGLASAPSSLLDQLAGAVSRFGDGALEQIAELAHDANAPVSERLGPIYALGAFRSKAAVVELMLLLQPDREEPDEITRSTCASLQRFTGLPYGDAPAQWRQWWEQAKDQPREEWMSQIIGRLSEQLAEMEQKVQREREIARSTEQRLAELYRQHFAMLASVDEQLAMLPPLLEDPLASVRGFALDRVARLLRDSVRINEELQHRIARRLDDEVVELRLQALRLLDQLGYEQTSALVADRLLRETSSDAIAEFLDVLQRRPSANAIAAVQPLLSDISFAQAASNVVWEALLAGVELPAEQIQPLRDTLRLQLASEPRPGHARLLARIGDEQDVVELQPLLDGGDDRMRRYVAEGFLHRGLAQMLLERADDPAIYPFAVQALATGEVDLPQFRTLVLLTPPEQHWRHWRNGLEQAIDQLAPELLLQADDLLASVHADITDVRLHLLQRGAQLPNDAISSPDRDRLTLRLARLLLDLHQPVEAHQLLAGVNGGDAEPASVRLMRFEAAALVGEFETAAQMAPYPDPWLELLYRIEVTDPETAVSIHEEIIRRFHTELAEEHEIQLEAVHERLQSNQSVTQSPA